MAHQSIFNNLPEYGRLVRYGQSLVGKKAQCRLLKEFDDKGNTYFSKAQEITGYEIVEEFRTPTLMLTIDGQSFYEDLLFNIH